ncbi:MaoC/PaaZ C-terminal domain-containing protein [Brachybacterium sp. Marseille-Q7125]|uniref:MaoC/PaaZ C-terminal domain-containing protein n=1 Tax=Brachybacterium sp. Marseille-Q7125 TaxID=2932815 RepID=UPI001FF6CA87|nr:MaoC/PaaZ C-terminal domain-containing protein [Brachybacterium sp. Marseille-Q7125]
MNRHDASRSGEERIKDLSDVPSFPAIYAAALDPRTKRGGGGREPRLPSIAYRVRKVRIDAERARDFDHLMGGAATDLVHPGVLHVLAFPVALALMARRDFPFPLLGVVHLRNQVLQHRPVKVGELVDVECRVRDLRPHRKGRTFEAVATILGQDGQIIATDVSTYLAKGAGTGDAAEKTQQTQDGESGSRRERFAPTRPTGRWRLGADTGRRYAAVSGDVNPIHLTALTAKAFGFPRAIAHGMYTASRAFTEARVDLSRPLRWDVTFDAPVLLPSTVLVVFEDAGAGEVRCVGWRPGRGEKPARRCFEVEVSALG